MNVPTETVYMYIRVRVCVNVDRAHVTSACCYFEITARKCRSFEEEEKGMREKKVIFDSWPSFSFSSGSGRRFKVVVSLVLVVGGLIICQLEEKIKKFVRVLLLLNTTCALFVLYCTLVIYIHK